MTHPGWGEKWAGAPTRPTASGKSSGSSRGKFWRAKSATGDNYANAHDNHANAHDLEMMQETRPVTHIDALRSDASNPGVADADTSNPTEPSSGTTGVRPRLTVAWPKPTRPPNGTPANGSPPNGTPANGSPATGAAPKGADALADAGRGSTAPGLEDAGPGETVVPLHRPTYGHLTGSGVWRKPPEPRRPFWTRQRRRYLRYGSWSVAGMVLLLALLVAWVALDAMRARDSLEQAARGVATLQADAVAGRTENLDTTVANLQEHAADARGATEGPHWSLVGGLPVTGPTVEAVAAMAATVDELAQGPLTQLADVVEVANPATLSPKDGRVDLAPLEKVAPDVKQADESVGYALQSVERIGGSPMLPQVSAAVADLEAQLADLRMSTATASRAAQLIPPMLGADGPRDYLVLVQNNAEPRSLGGITGTVLVLHADKGEIALTDQRPGSQVGPFKEPVLELTEEEQQIFSGDDLGRWMQNVTSTPDFPRSAQIAREMWRRETGQTVDGVLAVDPRVLTGLLGEVDTGSGGVLKGDDLVVYLLNGVYKTQSSAEQDSIFAQTAWRAFKTLSAGAGDPVGRAEALADTAREGRLLAWSSELTEADLLEGTVLDGALRGVNGNHPVVGVFAQGIQAAKIAYYVDTEVDVEERETRPDGSRELVVTVAYTSRVDAGEVPELSSYIVGPDQENRPGEIRLRTLVYAPAGGSISSASENSEDIGLSPQKHDELWLSVRDITLRPGATSSVTYVIITGKHQDGDVILRTTPGPRPVKVSIEE